MKLIEFYRTRKYHKQPAFRILKGGRKRAIAPQAWKKRCDRQAGTIPKRGCKVYTTHSVNTDPYVVSKPLKLLADRLLLAANDRRTPTASVSPSSASTSHGILLPDVVVTEDTEYHISVLRELVENGCDLL